MVEIGDKPVLWHIMNIYAAHGVTEFVIALGYKGEMIKDYFLNFCTSNSDISIDLASGRTTIHDNNRPPWTVHLVDTGLHTQTGGRLEAAAQVAGATTARFASPTATESPTSTSGPCSGSTSRTASSRP